MCTALTRNGATVHVVLGDGAPAATVGGPVSITLTLPGRRDKPDPGRVPAWPVQVR